MGEIKPLTGLRFVAAFGVMAVHMTVVRGSGGSVYAPFHLPFTTYPWMTLFFCLSGFVLTWTYAERVPVGRFLWARFARIYPLFAVVFVLEALVNGLPAGAFWDHALLVQAWTRDNGFFPVSWSLSAELFFYLLFPLIAVGLRGRSRRELVALALATLAVSLALAVLVSRGALYVDSVRKVPVFRLPDFVFGCLMARLALSGVRLPRRLTGLLLALGALLLFLPVSEPFAESAIYLAPLGLLMLALTVTDSRGGRVLGSRPLLALGTASYALYLSHPLIRDGLWGLTPAASAAAWLAACAVAITTSLVLYRRIEEPARRWLRRRRVVLGEAQPAAT